MWAAPFSPGQRVRERLVDVKLSVIASAVRGKRVVPLDDSVVRGTTAAGIVGKPGPPERQRCTSVSPRPLPGPLLLWHRHSRRPPAHRRPPHPGGGPRHPELRQSGIPPRACLGRLLGPGHQAGYCEAFWRGLRRRHTPDHREKTALNASGRKERERMIEMETKYVFITGGVISGLGKGITAASLGRLLKNRGYKVAAQKLDPYLNIDPGTMSPYQHGGGLCHRGRAEADLDLGALRTVHRRKPQPVQQSHHRQGLLDPFLNKERRGDYLGKDRPGDPHVTDEIQNLPLRRGSGPPGRWSSPRWEAPWGHRKPALSGGHPPSGRRGGPPKPCLSPCDPPCSNTSPAPGG